MNHQDFGYNEPDDFRRVLTDSNCVKFLIDRCSSDLDKARLALIECQNSLVSLTDVEEKSPLGETVKKWSGIHLARVILAAQKLGYLLAFQE